MRLKQRQMTPQEVIDIWEKEWGIKWADRLRFAKPIGQPGKYLSTRLDTVPLQPVVIQLHGFDSLLRSLAQAMKDRSPIPRPQSRPAAMPPPRAKEKALAAPRERFEATRVQPEEQAYIRPRYEARYRQ